MKNLPDSPVFKDAKFEQLIRDVLNKPMGEITAEDMDTIEILDAPSRAKIGKEGKDFDLSDISGIEYCRNLTFLDISFNDICDINGLRGLTKLKTLKINKINISDISALSELNNLEYLSIGNNPISDLSPVSGLKNLTTLWIPNTQVTNIEPLQNLVNLKDLNIFNMPLYIENLSPLSKLLSLKTLRIGLHRYNQSQESQLQTISRLTNLESLTMEIYTNEGNDITPLSNLVNLESLLLRVVADGIFGVSDLSPLRYLSKLENIDISGNNSNSGVDQSPVRHVRNVNIRTTKKHSYKKKMTNLREALLEKCDEASLDIYTSLLITSQNHSYDYYVRIFRLCDILNITYLYDIGCGGMQQAFLLDRFPCIAYTGIDYSKKNVDYHNTHKTNELFAEIDDGRICFQEGEYPFDITPIENNIAVSCFAVCNGDKVESDRQLLKNIASSLSRDFERIIITVSSDYLEIWKSELTAFELYKIGEPNFIFGTKFPEDIYKMRERYKYADNQFITGIDCF